MKIVTVSDGLIFIPEDKREVFYLWLLSFSVGDYGVCTNPDSYPMSRRLKLLKLLKRDIDSEYKLYIDHHLSGNQIKDHVDRTLKRMDTTLYTEEEKRGMQVLVSQLLKFTTL